MPELVSPRSAKQLDSIELSRHDKIKSAGMITVNIV